ncbi:MAG: hypothetical protein K6G67_08395 [Lachnospiraceae bacterium]|nr:hypothetical protein [Lachnospiraceae bacterium]
MRIAVAYIEDEEVNSQDRLRDVIGRVESLLGMNRFALVAEDNIVYTRYTTYIPEEAVIRSFRRTV